MWAKFSKLWGLLAHGDAVTVTAHPGRTRTGKGAHGGFSLFAVGLQITQLSATAEPVQERINAFADTVRAGAFSFEQAAALLPPIALVRALAAIRGEEQRMRTQLERAADDRRVQLGVDPKLSWEGFAEQPHTAGEKGPNPKATGPAIAQGQEQPVCEARLARLRQVAAGRQRGLVVVLEDPANAMNAAAVIRSCDSFGVTEVIFVFNPKRRKAYDPRSALLRKHASSSNYWVSIRTFDSTEACLASLKERQYFSMATALHSEHPRSLYVFFGVVVVFHPNCLCPTWLLSFDKTGASSCLCCEPFTLAQPQIQYGYDQAGRQPCHLVRK